MKSAPTGQPLASSQSLVIPSSGTIPSVAKSFLHQYAKVGGEAEPGCGDVPGNKTRPVAPRRVPWPAEPYILAFAVLSVVAILAALTAIRLDPHAGVHVSRFPAT